MADKEDADATRPKLFPNLFPNQSPGNAVRTLDSMHDEKAINLQAEMEMGGEGSAGVCDSDSGYGFPRKAGQSHG